MTFMFAEGLTSNTDYGVVFAALDAVGNCQPKLLMVAVHTADNVPPVTLSLSAENVTGTSAELRLQLDEPGTAFYVVMPASQAVGTCPSADGVFAAAATGNSSLAGSMVILARAPSVAIGLLTGLVSETDYLACIAAEDATTMHNRQTAVQRTGFKTLDITPPTLTVELANGSDGNVACSRAPPYLCNATWVATLSEPGSLRWALLLNTSQPVQLPSPAALMVAPQPSALLPPGAVVAEGNLTMHPSPSSDIQLASLASKSTYLLLVAAQDDASPVPNVAAAIAEVPCVAPDVQPPTFLDYALAAASDTSLEIDAHLDEPATVYHVLAGSPSVVPSVAEVLAGLAANATPPAAVGTTTSQATSGVVSVSPAVSGLQAGHLYDVHLVAVDASGNQQAAVTTLRWVGQSGRAWPVGAFCRDGGLRGLLAGPGSELAAAPATPACPTDGRPPARLKSQWAMQVALCIVLTLLVTHPAAHSGVRTTDSTPPSILSLAATWTQPMALRIVANVSKPGALRYLARRAGQSPPASAQALLNAVATNDLSAANFTGSLRVPRAGGRAAAMLCIADGDQMVIFAVAQDREGDNPGRWPNNGTMVRCVAVHAETSRRAATARGVALSGHRQ